MSGVLQHLAGQRTCCFIYWLGPFLLLGRSPQAGLPPPTSLGLMLQLPLCLPLLPRGDRPLACRAWARLRRFCGATVRADLH